MSGSHRLHSASPEEIAPEEFAAIDALINRVWPVDGRLPNPYRRDFETRPDSRPKRRHHCLWVDGELRAHAETFERTISLPSGPLAIMALASVCTDPDLQGRGYGRAVTLAAFERVDRGEFSLALFQTPVPEFYARLGGRVVENRFRDGLHPEQPDASPWWDSHVMIHPGSSQWDDQAVVDLCGAGY